MDIKTRFYDVVPFRRRRASDWILPLCAGLGFGLAAGVGFGLLFAPATGEEARLRLREGASRMKDRAAKLAARATNEVTPRREPMAIGQS